MGYAEDVGDRLRRIRMDAGLSLHDVERRSSGRWKAAVVGSYERGDRNISASRLLELAEFYGVSPADLLPGEPPMRRVEASEQVALDLQRLEELGDRFAAVRRYLEVIQHQRGDYNRRVLSIRGEDVRVLAVLHESSPEELLAELRGQDALWGG
jgi:transcriptional regulator with XRE-family HTH domain